MALSRQHELHTRRKGRNIGVSLLLVGFIVLVFALTFVKVARGDFETPATTSPATEEASS